MIDPITYLGYVKRENISIEIGEVEGMMSGIAIGICGLSTVFMAMFF